MENKQDIFETSEIQMTYRLQDLADCTEKEIQIKWLRLAQIQTGEAI
jgi:hypothetical protein